MFMCLPNGGKPGETPQRIDAALIATDAEFIPPNPSKTLPVGAQSIRTSNKACNENALPFSTIEFSKSCRKTTSTPIPTQLKQLAPALVNNSHVLLPLRDPRHAAVLPHNNAVSIKTDTSAVPQTSAVIADQLPPFRLQNNSSSKLPHVAFRLADQASALPEEDQNSAIMETTTTSDSELEELRLLPFANQVGGQSTVLAVDSNTICKPMISREARFYQRAPAALTPFIPQYKGELKVRFVRQNSGAINFVAMDPDPKLKIQRRSAMRAKSSAVLSEYARSSSRDVTTSALPTEIQPRKFSSIKNSTVEDFAKPQQHLQQPLEEPLFRSRCFSCSSNTSAVSAGASNLDVPSGSSHNDTEDDGEDFSSSCNLSARDSDGRRQSIGAIDSTANKISASKRHSAAATTTTSGSHLTVPPRSISSSANAVDDSNNSDSPLVHHTVTAIAPVLTETVGINEAAVPTPATAKKLSVGAAPISQITERLHQFRSKAVTTRGSTASLPGLGTGSPPEDDYRDRSGRLAGLKSWSLQCQEKTILKLGVQVGIDDVKKFILLENIASNYQMPCILDLKMGVRQHGDSADEEKRRKQIAKCEATTSKTLGVRACGMQVYRHDQSSYDTYDKYYGRSLSVDGFKRTLRNFLNNGNRVRVDLIPAFLRKLRELEVAVTKLDGFRFYSSSLLIMYDGREASPTRADSSRQLSLSSPDHGVEFDAAEEIYDDVNVEQSQQQPHVLSPGSGATELHSHTRDCSCCCKCRCACHNSAVLQGGAVASVSMPHDNKEIAADVVTNNKKKLSKTRMWTPAVPAPVANLPKLSMTDREREESDAAVDVRMIDFAHTSLPRTLRTQQSLNGNNTMPPSPSSSMASNGGGPAPVGQAALAEHHGPDVGYLFGLSNLIKMFEELLEQEEDGQPSSLAASSDAFLQHEAVIPSTPPLSAGLDKPVSSLNDELDRMLLSSPVAEDFAGSGKSFVN